MEPSVRRPILRLTNGARGAGDASLDNEGSTSVMPPVCAICLDTRRCWTCEGQGSVERALDLRETCPRCEGTGVCTECQTRVPVGGPAAPAPSTVPTPRQS